MVYFFFYNNLTNIELIYKINNVFEIYDGYIIIEKYNKEKNIIEINEDIKKNNEILNGKIVFFNLSLIDTIEKINNIKECKITCKEKYIVSTIWANKKSGGVLKTYIIY